MDNTKLKFYSLLVLIAAILIFTLISIDQVIIKNHHLESRQQVRDELNQVSNRLTFNLYNNIQVVKGLPALFVANPSLSQQDFGSAVAQLFGKNTQLRNIAAAPDLVTKYMYPLKGNEAAVGLDYRMLPLQIPSVLKAKESRQLILAGPLKLVQGGTGIISRIPVYLKKPTGEEYFWGIIAAVIDADRLYQRSGLLNTELPIEIAIRGKDGLGKSGDVFWGSPQLFDQDTLRATITLPSGAWELAARPINGWVPKPEDMLQKQLITYGVALTLFLMLFAFFKSSMNASNANFRFHALFDSSPDAILIASLEGNFIDGNKASLNLFGGITMRELRSKTVADISPLKQPCGTDSLTLAKQHIAMTNKKGNHRFEWVHKRLNTDEEFPCYVLLSRAVTDGKILIQATVRDITRDKRQQEKLELMAHYDVLTGLPNRALFVDRFHQAVAHSKRTTHQLAICFLDLDNFKPINDNYGHEVGDKLLIKVSSRLKETIRNEDTVSRQGGDEFALLLNDIQYFSQCEQTLQRIHHALAQPYLIDDVPHNITASTGVTLYPHDDEDIDTLVRHADQAMYQAKLVGKNHYQLFDSAHDQVTIAKHHKLDEIEQALTNDEFQLYYQPKVNMVSGEVFGAEALIRWVHPDNGIIPPLDFLPALEGTELEIKVGDWVINEALSQLDVWNKLGIQLEVSVNISSHHLQSSTFFNHLEATLAKHPAVDSQHFQLEILESSALGDLGTISTIIESCQGALGVNVALDDFGTGYSSLTHLRSLPVDTIKIDQTFVRDMLDDPSDYAIIDGIIGLAESFGRQLIAEGVETIAHGLMLLIMGCEQAQGYGIAKPMPADDFPHWLSNHTSNEEWQQCSSKHQTVKEKRRELFRLITCHWQELLIKNIQSSPDSIELWPIMNSKHCPCGAWIKRAKQEQLFEVEDLNKLGEAHEAVHIISHALHLQYQGGDVNAVREGLTQFQAAFDDMSNVLAQCE